MADKRQPHLLTLDACGRRVGMRARRPIRPDRAFAAASELPAQHLPQRFRRRAVWIEEMRAVEMIGDGAGIGVGTASGFHGLIGPKKAGFGKGLSGHARPEKWPVSASF